MEKNKQEEILQKLRLFTDRYQKTHSLNVTDFKVSKNMSSGNGFTTVQEGSIWNQDRAKVSVNLLEPAVNSIVYKFTDSPFDFKTDAPINLPELKFQLSSALREAVIDGLSYILVYKENDVIRFNRLKNFNVIYDDCEYPNGKDAKEVVYIDKKKVPRDKYKKSDIGVALTTVLNLTKYEVPVITYWVKDENGVTTYKIENEEVISTVTQPIDKIPIARVYAKEVFINYERNWRGLYYSVNKILQTIDFEMSLVQERIATAPNHKYWIAEESLGKDTEQYSKVNDIPTAYKTYKATNPLVPGEILQPPTRNDESTNLSDLLEAFGVHRDIISYILGTISGEERGTETAEAVLLRRESKDTAVNDLIKNLLDSAHLIADIITQFTGIEVTVASDIFTKAKTAMELEKMLAFCNYINNNPQAYAIAPVLIQKLDVDLTTQQTMLTLLEQSKVESQETQQKLEMLEFENKQLRANAESQLITAKVEQESRLATKQMDMAMKEEELKLEYAKLQVQREQIINKESIDGIKAMADIEAKEVNLALEAQKIRNDFDVKAGKLTLDAQKALQAIPQPIIVAGG